MSDPSTMDDLAAAMKARQAAVMDRTFAVSAGGGRAMPSAKAEGGAVYVPPTGALLPQGNADLEAVPPALRPSTAPLTQPALPSSFNLGGPPVSPEVSPGVHVPVKGPFKSSQALYNAAETGEEKLRIGTQYAGIEYEDQPEPEDLTDRFTAGVMESLPGILDWFVVPQRGLWSAATWGMERMLPDADSVVGHGLREVAAKVGAEVLTIAADTAPGVVSDKLKMIPGVDILTTDDFEEVIKTGVRDLYDALEDGSLRDRWEAKRDDTYVDLMPGEGVYKLPKADGIDIIDVMLPPGRMEQLRRIALANGDEALATHLEWMNTQVGREVLGLLPEFIIDPLNMAGPVKGVVVVQKGEKVFSLSAAMAKAAAVAGAGDAHRTLLAREALVSVALGLDDAADAKKLLEEAVVDAKRVADTATQEAKGAAAMAKDPAAAVAEATKAAAGARSALQEVVKEAGSRQAVDVAVKAVEKAEGHVARMTDEAFAKRMSTRLADQKAKAAIAARLNAYKLERAVADLGGVAEKGGFAWHLPFSSETRYLTSGATGRAVGKVAAAGKAQVSRHVGQVADRFSSVLPSAADLRAIPEAHRSTGQRVWLAAADATEAGKLISAGTSDLLGRVFRDRFYQPMLARARVADIMKEYGVNASRLLPKVDPQTWGAYQRALEKHFGRAAQLDHDLRAKMQTMTRKANATAKVLRKAAAADAAAAEKALAAATTGAEKAAAQIQLDRAKRAMSKGFSGQDIINEAALAIESGAGMMQGHMGQVLRPIRQGIEQAIEEVRRAFPEKELAELEQAALAISRHAAGDLDEVVDLTEALLEVVRSGSKDPLERWAKSAPDGWLDDPDNIASVISAANKAAKKAEKKGADIVGATLASLDENGWLAEKLKEVTPRIEWADAAHVREMQDFEKALWRGLEPVFEGHSQEHLILAAMAAIKNSPDLNAPMWKRMLTNYGQVVGTRLQDLDERMVPVVEAFRSILMSYEQAYAKVGMDFMKNPLQRLVDWGVVDYVPHIQTLDEKVARGRSLALRYTDGFIDAGVIGGDGLDNHFSTAMDLRKRRELRGTIEELNHLAQRMDGPATPSFTLDPAYLMARYTQANRAINATEFLAMMHEGKVLKRFASAQEDGAAGYIPLFTTPDKRDIDFLNAPRESIEAAAQTADLKGVLEHSLRMGRTKAAASPFASRVIAAPELAQSARVADAIGLARVKKIEQGAELLPEEMWQRITADVLEDLGVGRGPMSDEVMQQVRRETQNRFAAEINTINAPSPGAGTPPDFQIRGDWLTPAAWREPVHQLYAPSTVVQSMHDIFGEGNTDNGLMRAIRGIDAFFKTRLTITRFAFSMRNMIGNNMSNMLDLGVHGVLNPDTQMTAGRIATQAMIADAFGGGSWARAVEEIQRARPEDGARWRKFGAVLGFVSDGFTPSDLRKALDELGGSIDLGDGIYRTTDEALSLLREHGIITQTMGTGVDIAIAEANMLDNLTRGSSMEKAMKAASIIEDAVITILPMSIGGLPTVLPKKLGQHFSQWIETQGRLVNFTGNMKRSGDVLESAKHVNRFLFDYGDLTDFQKKWMRFFFPFFTWNFKNVGLHMDLMRESPAKFASMQRAFIDDVPRLFAGSQVNNPEELEGRQDYAMSRIRIPMPKWNGEKKQFEFDGKTYIEGFGSPIEAFADQVSMVAQLWNSLSDPKSLDVFDENRGLPRLASQGSFLARAVYETQANFNTFAGKPISETNEKMTIALIEGLTAEDIPEGVPGIGGMKVPLVGSGFKEYLNTKFKVTASGTPGGKFVFIADPKMNQYIGVSPWSSIVHSGMAFSDASMLHVSSAHRGASITGLPDAQQRTPGETAWAFLDAWTGIDLVYDNPEWARRSREIAKRETAERLLEHRGATYSTSASRLAR